MMLRKEYADVAEHVGKQMNEGFYGDFSRSTYILRDLAIKCQSIADEEIGKIEAKHSKLIQSTPYCYDPIFGSTWKMGFEAGQKALLTSAPLSVTGRWWQVKNGNIYFINKKDYEPYEQTTNSVIGCQWLSEEITIGFE